jgi:hypothetical protein
MKFAKLAILATALAATPIAASAQDVGATVYGNDGQPVGTIESNDGTNAVLKVGEFTAALPVSIFGTGENGPTINATRDAVYAQLKAADEQAKAAAAEAQAKAAAEMAAKRDAALIEGAAVLSADTQPVGMVATIDPEMDAVVVLREDGMVTLKREHFAVDADGALMALFTVAQLDGATVPVPEGAEIAISAE